MTVANNIKDYIFQRGTIERDCFAITYVFPYGFGFCPMDAQALRHNSRARKQTVKVSEEHLLRPLVE